MKYLLLLILSIPFLFSGCDYPDNPKAVAIAMCEATRDLDLSAMKKYATKAYGRQLKYRMESFKKALKANDPKAIALKERYAQIDCTDLTLEETMGRVMKVNSSSDIIAAMRLQRVERKWHVIQ